MIWETYRKSGSTQPIQVVSAYRSPTTNAMLRRRSKAVAEHSQHMLGKAMDMHYTDVPMSKIREIALRLQRGGVGYYPTSGIPFVHLDVGNVRYWPRMSYQALAQLFPDGKAVVPRRRRASAAKLSGGACGDRGAHRRADGDFRRGRHRSRRTSSPCSSAAATVDARRRSRRRRTRISVVRPKPTRRHRSGRLRRRKAARPRFACRLPTAAAASSGRQACRASHRPMPTQRRKRRRYRRSVRSNSPR